MRPLLRTFLVLSLVATASLAQAQETNAVTGIEVSELDASTEVRIRAFDHASYSVYRLRNPLRLFIDIAGSELAADGEAIAIDNGVLTQVAATEYQDDVTTVTRIVIGFEQDALYDVVA